MTYDPAMDKNTPPPEPDPRDFCRKCRKPIDVEAPALIPLAGVDAGVDCGACS